MHFCNISLHNCNNASLEECGKINRFMSVQVQHMVAPPAAYSFFMDIKNISILDHCKQMSTLFLQHSESRSENNSSATHKLNWKVQSYLFKVMYPTVLHKTTHKHLLTVNTTLLLLLLISHMT